MRRRGEVWMQSKKGGEGRCNKKEGRRENERE